MEAIMELVTGKKKRNTYPKRKHEPNNELSKTLKPGDVILTRVGGSGSWSSGVITKFTSSPYPHVELHLENGYDVSASETGVTYTDVHKYKLIDVFRYKKELTREQRLIMYAKAAQSVLKPYDYGHLFLFPFIKGKAAVRRSGDDAYICSELVAWIYNEAGLPLIGDRPEAIAAPADIGHSKELVYIGTFKKGWRHGDGKPNVFLPEDTAVEKGLGMANFMKALSTRDEFYAGLNKNKEKMLND